MVHTIVDQLLQNPLAAAILVAIVLGLNLILKASMKVIKWVALIGVAYCILVYLGVFTFGG